MLCSSFRRRKSMKESVRKASKPQSPPQQTENAGSHPTTDTFRNDPLRAPASSKKGKKKSRRKSKHKPRKPDKDVPIAEDVDPKPSDESIPGLQDETHHESRTVSPTGVGGSPTRRIPTVVSLEEE